MPHGIGGNDTLDDDGEEDLDIYTDDSDTVNDLQ